MKPNFINSMLSSGITGAISSKRAVMVWFVLNFTAYMWVNLFTGKTLEFHLANWIFEATMGSIVVVFGEPFIDVILKLKGIDKPPADLKAAV